jgi:hypothetical protein
MPNTSSNCRHWLRIPANQTVHADAVGECRSQPPVENFKWPKSRPTDWCSLHNQPALLAETSQRKAPEQTQPTLSLGEAPPATVGKTPTPAVRKTGTRSASEASAKTAS